VRKKFLVCTLLSVCLLFSGILLTGCLPHHHKWGEWSEFSALTCTKDQILIRTCNDCQTSEKKVGKEAKGHIFESEVIDPTEENNGYTLYKCHCGQEYKDNETCLITFESKTDNISINQSKLPQIQSKIINKNDKLNEIESTEEYKPVDYRIYLNSTSYTEFNINENLTKSLKITIMWDTVIPQELTQEEKEFYALIKKIERLESISTQYNTEKGVTADAQIRVLQYLRQNRYGDTQWNLFGGVIESDFSEYVIANQGSYNLQSLQTQKLFTVPSTKEQVDLIHMLAIINVVVLNGISNNATNDMVGWGGDLCQLTKELKEKNLNGTALQDKAYQLFGASSSTFSTEDLLADFDALNISNVYLNQENEKSISSALKEYYLSLTTAERKEKVLSLTFSNFVDSNTGEIIKTQQGMASEIISRLSSNFAIKFWCMQNNLNFTNDAEIFNAAAMAFAKYFI